MGKRILRTRGGVGDEACRENYRREETWSHYANFEAVFPGNLGSQRM